MSIDDLIDSFIFYEKDLAAEAGDKVNKKKSIALNFSKFESDEESDFEDEKMAMMARKFSKCFKKSSDRRKFRNFKNQKEKNEAITCYECKKPSHIDRSALFSTSSRRKLWLQLGVTVMKNNLKKC